MGIACAPQIWMDYITLILSELEHKAKYIAIMDDILVHSTKAEHWLLIEQLLQSMVKNGLRLSPKKCQFFKTNLVYMGNEFVISQKNITVTPLRSRTEAIVKIPTPHTPQQCKSFCGVVNYLALFYPDLQTLLKPIIVLMRKAISFRWGKEQEEAFPEVKHRISTPPVLHLPRAIGRLVLFSNTRKVGTGSSLWYYQDGKPHLIGYASKLLPEACSCYSVTELEMTSLLVNMGLWKNILKHREFDSAVDHVALTQILKAKKEPASNRIMRLLDSLSAYSFNLYYLKGKDKILADYLSRHCYEVEDPSDLIPVSFCKLRDIEDFCVGSRASVKASGEMVPEVHGVDKELDPHIMPEQQYVNKGVTPKDAKPKSTIKTPERDSPHKARLETNIDPVKVTQLKDKAEIASKSPKTHIRMPYSSPRVSSIQPKSFSVETRQKGDSDGVSVE